MINKTALPTMDNGPQIPDLREVMMTVWRHRLLVLSVGLVSLAVCAALIAMKPRTYQASATVMLDEQTLSIGDFHDVNQSADKSDVAMQTEVKLLTSPSLALKTVKALNLAKGNGGSQANAESAAVNGFLSNLTVTPQGVSRIIILYYKDQDPQQAAKILNAHIQSYMEAQVEFKKARVESLGKWFKSNVADLQAEVLRKSTAIEQFRATNGLAVGKDSQELVYQQISETSSLLAPLQARKDDIESRLQALDTAAKSKDANAIGDIVKSPLIETLKSQASVASQQVQSLRAQYGANHPKLQAAKSQLSQVNGAIAREVSNIGSAMRNEYEAASSQEQMLQARLTELKGQGDKLRTHLVTLNSLIVDEQASQKVLDAFLSNYQTIESQMTFAHADAVVVSPATPPLNPAPPGKKLLLLAALVLSGLLALGSVFAVELMRGGVANFEDVRRMGRKPIGIMPLARNPMNAMAEPGSSFTESIKRVYMGSMLDGGSRTVLVTSALPNEGRTTFTISLARYMASLGHRVLVIDADFLKPTISGLALGKTGPGLTDVLAGNAALKDAISSDDSGVAILRAGSRAALSPDTLRSESLQQLFTQLKQQYAYVLIDSAPLLAHSEAGVIANQADGIIVLTEWMKTSEQNIANMFATLDYFSAPVLGVVISKVDLAKYKKVTAGSDFLLPKMASA